jgi:4-hydroxybenzoate polyprenyltransferase
MVVVSLRPGQWTKNVLVFAGLVFGQKLFTSSSWVALAAFAIFCGLSGAIYLLNDIADRDRDSRHPVKRNRPIASGGLSIRIGGGVALVLLATGLAAGAWLSTAFTLVAIAYIVLLGAYSVWLKHVVIIDVLAVAAGFVLRAAAGAIAVDVKISGWLLICTILISLFLALGKRRHEYLTLAGEAGHHRPVLMQYSPGLLDQMIAVVTASTVTAYGLYTMASETVAKFNTEFLPATLVFVLYGIFRYLYLLYRCHQGGNPSELLLNDRALMVNLIGWVAAVILIIYGPR